MIEGGFWSKENSGTLAQCHLRIALRPDNNRGALLVQVDLATECWTTPDDDRQQSVTARFLTLTRKQGEGEASSKTDPKLVAPFAVTSSSAGSLRR